MISFEMLILLLGVAALAFYAGMQFGRQQVLAAGRSQGLDDDVADDGASQSPRPTPITSAPKPVSTPRGAPPPASAGAGQSANSSATSSADTANASPPRRTSPPPPASAGVMGPAGKPK
jgi:hypothetical protein